MELKVIKKNDSQKSESIQLAKNLQDLLRNKNLNANQLAHILNIPMMTIRRLLSGETTDPRISTVKIIADYFKTSVDALIQRNDQSFVKNLKRTKPYFIPKLNWETAGRTTNIQEIDLSGWKEWQAISLSEEDAISEKAFALESRPSMYPRFPQGTVFVIDPDLNPTDGDIVLIKLKKNNELTLRELTIDPPEWQLHSIITESNTLYYSDEDHTICGVNLMTMLYNRKL